MYKNKVEIIGNLTKDPELKALPSGVKVTNLSVATNRTWKDSNGAKQEGVEYHNIVAFAKQAEVIAQYCHKGDQILVEGRLQTRNWEGEDGKKRYVTDIILESFQFGSKTKNSESTNKEEQTVHVPQNQVEEANEKASQAMFGRSMTDEEAEELSEIPF